MLRVVDNFVSLNSKRTYETSHLTFKCGTHVCALPMYWLDVFVFSILSLLIGRTEWVCCMQLSRSAKPWTITKHFRISNIFDSRHDCSVIFWKYRWFMDTIFIWQIYICRMKEKFVDHLQCNYFDLNKCIDKMFNFKSNFHLSINSCFRLLLLNRSVVHDVNKHFFFWRDLAILLLARNRANFLAINAPNWI